MGKVCFLTWIFSFTLTGCRFILIVYLPFDKGPLGVLLGSSAAV